MASIPGESRVDIAGKQTWRSITAAAASYPMGKAQSALKACCKPSVDAASEQPPEHLTLDAAYAPSIPDSVDSQFRLASQARDGRQRMQVVQHAQEWCDTLVRAHAQRCLRVCRCMMPGSSARHLLSLEPSPSPTSTTTGGLLRRRRTEAVTT